MNMTKDSMTIFYITKKGQALAERISGCFPGTETTKFDSSLVGRLWPERKALIFIMASGIVIRTISSLLKDKKTDPAVVVLDERGEHAVSLVGGHLGGANRLAKEIAACIGADAVITTASDVNDLPSIDIWAKENGLIIEDWESVSHIATRLINQQALQVYTEMELSLPEAFKRELDPGQADILITRRQRVQTGGSCVANQLYLRPRDLVAGIGCNSGTSSEEIEDVVRSVLLEHNLSFASLGSIATIALKASEPGLRDFAFKYNLKIELFDAGELNRVEGIEGSDIVFRATGAKAVAEPAVILASGSSSPLVPKIKSGNVTISIAVRESGMTLADDYRMESRGINPGYLFVVGTGPGGADHITPRARKAIEVSDVIVGYKTYLELIPELLQGKETFSTGMTQEIDRCRKAVELSLSGKTVSVISGGDPGIYAMAGLVFETLINMRTEGGMRMPDVEIIPGISALNAAASRLGAPLMHDFASISLSDRLTPWDVIEKRLNAAAMADFVMIIYNPRSRGRTDHFARAVDIIRRYRKPSTPVGIVQSAMRRSEKVVVTNLEDVLGYEIDMQTTVVIGNSATYVWNSRMITPRGYEKKLSRG